MEKKFVIENGIMKSETRTFDKEKTGLGNWLLEVLRSKPDFVGQMDVVSGQETTYKEMFERSSRCALWMRKQNINSEDIVLTCCSNQSQSFIPLLATFYNAATHIFVQKGINHAMTKYLLNSLKPKFIFTEEEEVQTFEEVSREENQKVQIIVFSKIQRHCYLNDILEQSESKELDQFHCIQPTNSDNNCMLGLTSGSTGNSKVVVYSYKSVMNTILLHISNRKKDENVVSLLPWPLFWIPTVRMMLDDIISFTKRVIVNETIDDFHQVLQLVEKYKVTKTCFSIRLINQMYKYKGSLIYDTSSIKILHFTGLKLQPHIIKFLNKFVKNGCFEVIYGATEYAAEFFLGIMNKIDINSCGYLSSNMSMKVVDVQTGKVLGPGESGELCFKSSYYAMKGYFNNKEATDEAIDSEGWYHSGDLGYYDNSGLGYVLGRIKNSLTLPDGKIAPLWNIDRALLLNSEVVLTVILPVDEISQPLSAFVFVELLPDSKITEEELTEIANIYNDINLLITVKILDAIPLTCTGKIDLREARKKMNDFINKKK